MFPAYVKRFSSLIRVLSGIFRHCKTGQISTIVSLCIFNKLFLNRDRAIDLGRYRLILIDLTPHLRRWKMTNDFF